MRTKSSCLALSCLACLVLLIGPAPDAGSQQPGGGAIQVPATVVPFEQTDLRARVKGYVKKVYVDIGDQVKSGDVLADIEVPELVHELNQKKALVRLAEAGIDQAKQSVAVSKVAEQIAKESTEESKACLQLAVAKVDFSKARYERLSKLAETGSIDKALVDEARFDVNAAEASVKQAAAKFKTAQLLREEAAAKRDKAKADVLAAEVSLLAAQADLMRVQALLQYAQIRAPFDGVILRRSVDAGTLAMDNFVLFTVARLDKVRIVGQVPEASIARLTVGTPATVHIHAFKGAEFKGKVSRLAATVDPKTQTLRIEIDLPNLDGRILPGMSATVHLAAQAK
jgi:multidrug efflux pump subunit AcrA (membrane-fusion protein)